MKKNGVIIFQKSLRIIRKLSCMKHRILRNISVEPPS